MKKSYWTGIIIGDKTASISDICSVIDKHGIILNSQRFSDISVGLLIEVEQKNLSDLFYHLESIMHIEGFGHEASDSSADCIVLLNVTFTKGTGDLLIEVPDIPD